MPHPFRHRVANDGTPIRISSSGSRTSACRESPNSLYSEAVVTFEDDQGAYDQVDAQGFIKLNALRLRIAAKQGRPGGAL